MELIFRKTQLKNAEIILIKKLVKNTYQVYPDGSGIRWGFPQMPDTQGVFMRKDMLEDPAEQAAFKAKTGKDLPTTAEAMYEIEFTDLVEIIEFFHRPDKEMYGTAMMYSKEYDFFSCAYYPFAYSTGGKIWDPATSDVYGILNSDINAAAMDKRQCIRACERTVGPPLRQTV